jgi:hypothetical protein
MIDLTLILLGAGTRVLLERRLSVILETDQ